MNGNGSNLDKSTMPDLNFEAMETSKNTIREAYQKLPETGYDAFRSYCQQIYNQVNDTFDEAKSSVITVKTKLASTKQALETSNTLIKALQAQITDENADSIHTQIKSLRQQGDANITATIDLLNPTSTGLTDGVNEIEFHEFKRDVEEEIKEVNQELTETVLPNIEKYEGLKAKAQEDYQTITEAMFVFEQHNLFDFVSEVIPSPEELATLLEVGMESPELAAVIAGIGVFQEFVEEIGEGFSYAQMVQVRNFLDQQIRDYTQELENLNARKRQLENTLEDLGYILTIEGERFTFTEQVKNLASVYTTFAEDLTSLMTAMGDYDNYDNVLVRLGEMVEYLQSLQAYFN